MDQLVRAAIKIADTEGLFALSMRRVAADLGGVARHVRATLLRHPWLASELTGRPALGANSLRQYDLALTAATALTADVTLAANAIDTVLAYVHGAVARELAEQQAGSDPA